MFELEKSIHAWKRNLHRQESLEDGTIADLEIHLRDAIDDLRSQGLSEEEAFREAAGRVGGAKSLASECGKVREYRLDLRSPWRLSRFMPALFGNYLKIALRKIRRGKGYSFINIGGLALGIACVLLIMTFVRYELGYDRQRPDADRIYRVAQTCYIEPFAGDSTSTPALLAAVLKEEFPEVEASTRIRTIQGHWFIRADNGTFKEARIVFADSGVFDILSLPLVSGHPKSALLEPHTAIISQSVSRKYFGETDPIGKTLLRTGQEGQILYGEGVFTVTGIFRDLPAQTHLHADVICSWTSLGVEPDWNPTNATMTYIKLKKKSAPRDLESKFPAFISRKIGPWLERISEGLPPGRRGQMNTRTLTEGRLFRFFLQPVTSIHLFSHLQREAEPNGDIKDVLVFSVIAVLTLALACINFINLTTARSSTRAREVGIRKTAGAPRSRLIRQFLAETGVLTSLSFVLALALARLLLPFFSRLAGRPFETSDLFADPALLVGVPVLILVVTLLAGSYPAFVLSSLQPAIVLKGNFQNGPRARGLRRGLVILQFAAGLVLTLVTLVIFKQIRFIRTAKLGFDREQVLLVHNAYLLGPSITAFKESLSQSSDIAKASVSSFLPVTSNRTLIGIQLEGTGEAVPIGPFFVDEDYIKTMGMDIVQGRDFSEEFVSDPNAYRSADNPNGRIPPAPLPAIINETAARRFGWPEPLGKQFAFGQINYTIIGVVLDFHFSSFHRGIEPLVLLPQRSFDFVSVRLRAKNPGPAIEFIRAQWKEFAEDFPLEYSFMDDGFNDMYRAEQRSGRLYGIFACLALLISTLGLIGLAAFMAEQRTKEIGVRKVLGASIGGMVALISREFLLLVGIANLIAWPVAYFFMKKWLEGFAYRTSIGAATFLAAGLFSLILTLVTVGFQAVKAASADPIRALKYE